MSDTTTTTTEAHPHSALHDLLVKLVAKAPWHSEDEYHQAMQLARDSEQALAGDSIDAETGEGAVVPPAPVLPAPVSAVDRATAAQGGSFDYAKLASEIIRQQSGQAAAAVQADPTFEPPGAVTVSGAGLSEQHAGAEAAAADPDAQSF